MTKTKRRTIDTIVAEVEHLRKKLPAVEKALGVAQEEVEAVEAHRVRLAFAAHVHDDAESKSELDGVVKDVDRLQRKAGDAELAVAEIHRQLAALNGEHAHAARHADRDQLTHVSDKLRLIGRDIDAALATSHDKIAEYVDLLYSAANLRRTLGLRDSFTPKGATTGFVLKSLAPALHPVLEYPQSHTGLTTLEDYGRVIGQGDDEGGEE